MFNQTSMSSDRSLRLTPLMRDLQDILRINPVAHSSIFSPGQLPSDSLHGRSLSPGAYNYHSAPTQHHQPRPNSWSLFDRNDNPARAVGSEHSLFNTSWGPPEPNFSLTEPQTSKNSASYDFFNAFQNDHHPQLWEGDLEPRDYYNSSKIFSLKIFIGGIPRDMTEEDILSIFGQFDADVRTEWPESKPNSKSTPKGYLYIIFTTNENVKNLLYKCELEVEGGCETFNFSIPYKGKTKRLQVIPWLTSDRHFTFSEPTEVQRAKFTVFVGALHGRLHAKAIAHIFNKTFKNVLMVSIDTDRHKYPTGSGRITFSCVESYKSAIVANFIHILAKKVDKKVQIEPCIDGQKCCSCKEEDAPNFCKEKTCFEYYCNACWDKQHYKYKLESVNHVPIRRKSKFEY